MIITIARLRILRIVIFLRSFVLRYLQFITRQNLIGIITLSERERESHEQSRKVYSAQIERCNHFS